MRRLFDTAAAQKLHHKSGAPQITTGSQNSSVATIFVVLWSVIPEEDLPCTARLCSAERSGRKNREHKPFLTGKFGVVDGGSRRRASFRAPEILR